MGKGGQEIKNEDTIQTLEKERGEKVKYAPDFMWVTSEDDMQEPHVKRRKDIVTDYPEVKQYFGPDLSIKYKACFALLFQLLSVHLLQGAPWYIWVFCCYTISGSINHGLTLAIHEASHNLVAKGIVRNRFWGIFANLSMGIPAAITFKRYHMEHHRFQGEDILDVDIPSKAEGWFFQSTPRKILWCFLQPVFYSFRPSFINPKAPTKWEFLNYAVIFAFDAMVVQVFGWSSLAYLAFGTLLGMGVHPVAGHFISEHYVMHQGQETYSYYGPLNWLTFMVGYHNEHHDFPFVTGKNLCKVRSMAPEYYDDISHYHSWVKVIYDYIMDVKISPYSRVKRVTVTNDDIQKLRDQGGLVKY